MFSDSSFDSCTAIYALIRQLYVIIVNKRSFVHVSLQEGRKSPANKLAQALLAYLIKKKLKKVNHMVAHTVFCYRLT